MVTVWLQGQWGEEIGRSVNTGKVIPGEEATRAMELRRGQGWVSQKGPQGLGGGGAGHGGAPGPGVERQVDPTESQAPLSMGPSGTSAGLQTWQLVPKTPKLKGRIGWSLWALGFHSKCVSKLQKLFFFLINLFIYLFLAAMGLRCCACLSLVAVSRGYSSLRLRGLLIAVASLVAEHGL